MPKIARISLWRARPTAPSDPRVEGAFAWMGEGPVTGPLAALGYDTPDNSAPGRPLWGGQAYVQVETDDGLTGVGAARYGDATAAVLSRVLVPLLLGRDAADTDGLWDLMLRQIAEYGGAGHALAAVSGVDCALWDLAGKRAGLPVHRVISPNSVANVRLYATGPTTDAYVGHGYTGVKVWLRGGSTEEQAVWLRAQHARLDPGAFLAVDCYMGLEAPDLVALHRQTEDLDIAFWEEPLRPWQIDELVELRAHGIPVASGEHNSHFEIERMVRMGAVDVVQPELNWSGGITGGLRIARLAADHGVRFIPHSGGLMAFHLAAGVGGLEPEAEFSFYHCAFPGEPEPSFWPVFDGSLRARVPVDGRVTVPDTPGFGLRVNPAAVLAIEIGG